MGSQEQMIMDYVTRIQHQKQQQQMDMHHLPQQMQQHSVKSKWE